MNEYRSAMDKVVPSKALAEKTILRMEHAEATLAKDDRLPRFKLVHGFAAAAACLLLLLIVPALLNSRYERILITGLETGEHISYVELTDGFLMFGESSDDIRISPDVYLGIRGAREEWDIDQYEQYTGIEVSLPYLPDEFHLEDESAIVYLDDGLVAGDYYEARYQGANGGELTVSISVGALPKGSNYDAADNSLVRGQPLYAAYNAEEERYYVQFMREGIGYLIEAGGISQEELITVVWYICK